jgi:hypothetical protein
MPKRVTTRTRRTPEQIIEDLQRKIEEVKARAAKAKLKKDPALRHISGALRAIDKALAATKDTAVRTALGDARATLAACASLDGAVARKAGRRKTAASIDPGQVLIYVQNNPGSSGEQIAEAQGTDTATLRPVLRQLIEGGAVKTSGKGRGTRYAAL